MLVSSTGAVILAVESTLEKINSGILILLDPDPYAVLDPRVLSICKFGSTFLGFFKPHSEQFMSKDKMPRPVYAARGRLYRFYNRGNQDF